MCSTWRGKGVEHDGRTARWPETRRRRSQAAARTGEQGVAATAHESENGEGEKVRWLTAVAADVEVGSGKAGRRRVDDGDPRRPAMKKRPVTVF